ncbi:adenosine deaminase [Microlunatus spumicola]|uniref:adenosine deaminase n=1 Tax=Microlunatus spumicola TaxID=81499 RepID=A0ABP6XSK8_9ACTN
MPPLDVDRLRALPKVSLHDHLDGGLRPATVLELSEEIGHVLPPAAADGAEALGRWFVDAADSGSLVRYLETFDHTIAVMQTAPHLRRVAREFAEDLAADGVVYGEARWAPEQHTTAGLTQTEAVAAVATGLEEGMAAARARGQEVVVRQLLTSMRHVEPTLTGADLVLDDRTGSVVGFDIAGAEDGFPPERFLPAFVHLRTHGWPYTIHAGEAAGVDSIAGAVLACGATRVGHGVRIVEDIGTGPDGGDALGPVAAYVRDRRVPLELCPSSNVQTGAVTSVANHPIARLDRLGFKVTVNCDNQLMSGTTLTRETGLLVSELGYDLDGLRRLAVNAAESIFQPYPVRRRLIEDVILPAYAR